MGSMASGQARRRDLEGMVQAALGSASDGFLTATRETQSLDFKEEAGRRTRTGELEPGEPENPAAAVKLADDVACFANSPGGGALILGVDDKTGEVLGTELNVDWLRHRIYRAVDVAPDIVEHNVGGQRLLVLYVAQAFEPVENTSGGLRWRVGEACEPVDRAAWWNHQRQRRGADAMAAPAESGLADVPHRTIARLRRLLNADATETDRDLLHRIGALTIDGHLTLAAETLLVPPGRALLDMTILDVEGGHVLNRIVPPTDLALLDQIDVIEDACAVVDTSVAVGDGFVQESIRRVPMSAVREAILNGVSHRDWDSQRPTEVRWVEADSTLTVRSPGGFTGGVTESNVLTHRHPRHPALSDLLRVLDLVEKQGLGIDRMYTSMITLGHRPPRVVETPGPYVLCELVGGPPHRPIRDLFRSLRPEARQRDVRIVLLVDALLRHPFLTDDGAAAVLQTDALSARGAFEAARQTTLGGTPIVRRYKDVWMLGERAFDSAMLAHDRERAVPVMSYTGSDGAVDAISAWVATHESITSGDVMELASVSRATAQRVLNDLNGSLLRREGAGRTTRFLPLRGETA